MWCACVLKVRVRMCVRVDAWCACWCVRVGVSAVRGCSALCACCVRVVCMLVCACWCVRVGVCVCVLKCVFKCVRVVCVLVCVWLCVVWCLFVRVAR